jgi:homoserine dehydrogenase
MQAGGIIMAGIAILGYGVVGSGVYAALEANHELLRKKAGEPLEVKAVLDLRSFPGDPAQAFLTADIGKVIGDESIKVVVETMGGVSTAFEYSMMALEAGKHVVTSNKALVAKHGATLIETAKRRGVSYLFEASVGGGTPIIRPLNHTLLIEKVQVLEGILNGTTNYVLSQMELNSMSFLEALTHAQEKGYAERDPSDDIEGYDTSRKLAILLSLATGKHVGHEDIPTESSGSLEKDDFIFANAYGCTIKLMAKAVIGEGMAEALVCPMAVPRSSVFAAVNDVYNALMVTSNISDNIMFYGRGAGKFPTAAAILADIADALASCDGHVSRFWSSERLSLAPLDNMVSAKLVRLAEIADSSAKSAAEAAFGQSLYWIEAGQSGFISPPATEAEFKNKMRMLETAGVRAASSLRIYAHR